MELAWGAPQPEMSPRRLWTRHDEMRAMLCSFSGGTRRLASHKAGGKQEDHGPVEGARAFGLLVLSGDSADAEG
jgi:hypothetical protein